MEIIEIEDGIQIIKEYNMYFQVYSDGGFSFPCSPSGEIEECKFPEGKENLRKVLSGEIPYKSKKLEVFVRRIPLCSCGSGEASYCLYDARDIYIAHVCGQCEEKKKSHYRPEIFTGYYDDSGATYEQIMGYDN